MNKQQALLTYSVGVGQHMTWQCTKYSRLPSFSVKHQFSLTMTQQSLCLYTNHVVLYLTVALCVAQMKSGISCTLCAQLKFLPPKKLFYSITAIKPIRIQICANMDTYKINTSSNLNATILPHTLKKGTFSSTNAHEIDLQSVYLLQLQRIWCDDFCMIGNTESLVCNYGESAPFISAKEVGHR